MEFGVSVEETHCTVRIWIDAESFLLKIFEEKAIAQGGDIKIKVSLILVI